MCSDASGWGGAEVVLRTVLEALTADWDVALVATDASIAGRVGGDLPGVRTELVPPVQDRHDRPGVLRHLRAVRCLRGDVALVNLPQPYAAPFLSVGCHDVARLPTVAVEHLPLPTESGFELRLKRWSSRRLAAHVCVGEQASRRLEGMVGLPAHSVSTVCNGVPWRTAAPLPLPEGLPRPCLSWVGRLVHQKGVETLLRALALVPGVGLWIDGEGDQRAALEELSASLGLQDRVRFTGWGPDPRGVLAAADLAAMPGRQEAWGLVLVEALQAGLPLVVTDLPENRELMAGAAALFPLDDHVALAALLRELLADPARLAAMREASLQVARGLPSVEDMTRSYDQLLREAARARGRLPAAFTASLPAAPGGRAPAAAR